MKVRFLALVALVLGLASCQKDTEGFDVAVNGEVSTTVTVNLADASGTRAGSNESGIENGALDGDNTIRYILQVFDETGEQSKDKMYAYTDDETVTFDVRLVPGRNYNFVVWADVVKPDDNGNYNDWHYDTTDLKAITLKGAWNAMDETRDAFTCVESVADFNATTPINITLTRPFAKLRVVTTDMLEIMGVNPQYAEVEYTTAYRPSFNAFAGSANAKGSECKTHTYRIATYNETGASKTLFTDYLFAIDEQEPVQFILSVYEDNQMNALVRTTHFNTDIPVKRNFLTTITGNVLTDGNNIKVTVVDSFAQPDIEVDYVEVSTAADLQEAINNPETIGEKTHIVVSEDIVFGGTTASTSATRANNNGFIFVPAGKEVVIDLNGKNIIGTETTASNFGLIQNNGTLTICGEGNIKLNATVNSGWNRYSAVISNNPGAVLTVNDATIEHLGGTDMAYGIDILTNGGNGDVQATINSGTIKSTYRAVRQFLNSDSKNNTLVINGGTIEGANKSIFFHDPSTKANKGKLVVNEDAKLKGDVYLYVTAESTEWPVEVSIAASALEGESKVTSGNVPFGYVVTELNGKWVVDHAYAYDDKTYHIYSAAGLVYLSENGLKAGDKVLLEADIDLTGIEFNGLDTFHPENGTTFDGQGYTVSNWTNNSGASDMGFIRNWVGTIKNVNFKECHLKTNGRSAIAAAKVYGNIENVTIDNCTLEDSYWACGLVAGLYNAGNISGCTVTNSSIKSNGGTGGIVGVINESAGTRKVENCKVEDCTVNNTGDYGDVYSGALICGMINIEKSTVEFNNCSYKNNTKQGKYVGDLYYSAGDDITVKIDGVTVANTVDALKAAMKDNATVVIGANIENATIMLPATLNNFTLRAAEGVGLKNSTISAADGNAYHYENLTFDGITFDNSRILLTGWRNGEEVIKNLTVTNCVFNNLDDDSNTAPVHINKDASEAVENFTFTNNVINGAIGGSKSGVYAQLTGNVVFENNVINNVSFRPYVIQITTDDGIADTFSVKGNTFSGSSKGRAQGLGNNDAGTDVVKIVVSGNIFKGITESQQICYWNFNPETTTADLSKNYYDIDIEANPSRIYYNSAASSVEDLKAMGVYPYYTELNADGTINLNSLKQAE